MPMVAPKQGTERIGRRLKLRDLRILMTVVECATMGKAAERLAISQPVVSKAIADMEDALGVRLLDRSRRGVEPTPYGRALIKRGIAIFDEMRQGIEEIEFLSDPTAGEVRIGATDAINAAIIAPVIDRLSRQYPRMTFHVVAGVPGPLRQEVAARNVDFAISRFARPVGQEYSEEILFHDALVVVTGPNNPLTRRRKIELAELLSEPWIRSSLISARCRRGSFARPGLIRRGLPWRLRPSLCATSCSRRDVSSLWSSASHSSCRVNIPDLKHCP
jgi:DNA-binding transcriptional LysR family regulator